MSRVTLMSYVTLNESCHMQQGSVPLVNEAVGVGVWGKVDLGLRMSHGTQKNESRHA